MPLAKECIKAAGKLVLHRRQRRQPQRGDECANQPRAWQVYPFSENATQHREGDAIAIRKKAFKEAVARSSTHGARLAPLHYRGMPHCQPVRSLLEVIETAEESDVIARMFAVLARNQLNERVERGLAVRVAGGKAVGDLDAQVLRRKWRRNVNPPCVIRQAEKVALIGLGAQRG